MAKDRFRLGGRIFVPLGRPTTLEHDIWVTERIRAAGLMPAEIGENEDREAFARRVLFELELSGKGIELLGGMLLPKGTKSEAWTPRLARETSAHLMRVVGAEEKALIVRLQIAMLMSFFEEGPAYIVTSKSSSPQARPELTNLNADSGSGVPSSMH